MNDLQKRLDAALNRLTKWRSVFAGWQLGTRTDSDPECQAVRDHREITILLRAENTALLKLLLDKGIVTVAEFDQALLTEAETLDLDYQKRFPGFRSSDEGMVINPAIARDTTAGWRQ